MNAPHSSGRTSRRRRRPLIRSAAPAVAATLALLPLTACGSGDAGADDGRVEVVASFYPMEFLAEEIGGEHVDVTPLASPGVDPHDLELTPKQIGLLGDADLVVYLKGLQPAVDEAVEQSDVAHVAEATSLTSMEKHGTEHGGEHGTEHGGEHGHEAEEGDGGHEGHDHTLEGGADPHVWLDPVRYAEIAEGVGEKLADADPKHEKDYRKNTEELVSRLEQLDEEFRSGLKDRKTDTFVTTHAAFGYLADRYGLHEESITGVDPASGSISAAHIDELHRIVKEDEVSTVFSASRADDDAARTLAQDLGLRTGVLSPLESVDDSGTQDYFSVMHQNLQTLRTALGAR